MVPEDVNECVEDKVYKPTGLISILEKIQSKYSYLPEKELKEVAEKTGRSLVDIYGIATFYKSFSLKPRGKHLISVCLGTACHVRGGPAIARELEKELGIKAGETTENREFTLETVNCLGACALGPVVVVDGHYFPQVKVSLVSDILRKTRTGLDVVKVETDERIFPVEVSCSRCNHSLMHSETVIDGYPAIRVTVSFDNKHGWLALSSLYGSHREFTMETVNCLGACALGPVVVVDGHYFPQVKASLVSDIIRKTRTGLDVVQVETDERIFPVEVSCSRCNHSLMHEDTIIDGYPAIRVTVSFDNKHGWLALSSLYGSHRVVSLYEIPPGTILNIFCPHCHAELIGGAKCGACGAPMVPMIVRGGGVVQICARRGCKEHILDVGGSTVE